MVGENCDYRFGLELVYSEYDAKRARRKFKSLYTEKYIIHFFFKENNNNQEKKTITKQMITIDTIYFTFVHPHDILLLYT